MIEKPGMKNKLDTRIMLNDMLSQKKPKRKTRSPADILMLQSRLRNNVVSDGLKPLIEERDREMKRRGCTVVRNDKSEHDKTCCLTDEDPSSSDSSSDNAKKDQELRIIDEYGAEVCFDRSTQRNLSPAQRAKIANGKIIVRQKHSKKTAA